MKNNDNNKEKSLINMLPMSLSGEINEIWVSLPIDKYFLIVQEIIWNVIPGQFQAPLQKIFWRNIRNGKSKRLWKQIEQSGSYI